MICSEVKIKVKISIFGEQKKKLKSNFVLQNLSVHLFINIDLVFHNYAQFQKIISQHFISSDNLIFALDSYYISQLEREKTSKNIYLNVGQFMNDIKEPVLNIYLAHFLRSVCVQNIKQFGLARQAILNSIIYNQAIFILKGCPKMNFCSFGMLKLWF